MRERKAKKSEGNGKREDCIVISLRGGEASKEERLEEKQEEKEEEQKEEEENKTRLTTKDTPTPSRKACR